MQTEITRDLPSVIGLLDEPLRSFLNPFEPAIERLFSFDRLRQCIETARNAGGGESAGEMGQPGGNWVWGKWVGGNAGNGSA